MTEFDIKDNWLIVHGPPGGKVSEYSINDKTGELLIKSLAKETGRTKEDLIKILRETGPKEL
jgi:hypothetical protein